MLDWLRLLYSDIQTRMQRGKLHHGLIFHGKQGVGKAELCKSLAKLLLCKGTEANKPCGTCQSCKLFVAENHPDFIQVVADKSIGVDAVRGAISQLLHTSQLSGSKVLFVDQAQLMTVAAANALLKTLEEPTANTYILLTCQSLHELLPTVLSRCEKHAVAVTDKGQVINWLQQNHVSVEQQLIDLYWQRPLFLRDLSNNETASNLEILANISQGQSITQFPVSFFEQPELVISWIQQWLSQRMKEALDNRLHLEQLLQFSQQLQGYKSRCNQQGSNKKLQLSLCMADFAQISSLLVEKR
ncbi:MAG: AAA family ATPase [Aestuariibacter sp.]